MIFSKYTRLFTKALLLSIGMCFIMTSSLYAQWGLHDIKLSWRDFVKKNVAVSSNATAMTFVELKLTSSVENDKLLIMIELIQDRNKSWVSKQFLRKATDQESRALLDHEKLHYVINLIGLKKLYEELSNYDFSKEYKSELAGIFNRVNRITTKANSDYDRQTTHGLKKEEQERWTQDILEQLNEMYPKGERLSTNFSILKTIN